MKKYVLIFTISYLLLTIALAIITSLLKVGGGTTLNIAVTIASSFIAAWQFTKEQERIPTTEENNSYARLALAGTWAVSLLLVIAFLALLVPPTELETFKKLISTKIFLIIFPIAFIVLSVIYYFVIKWSFSWYAKQTYKV